MTRSCRSCRRTSDTARRPCWRCAAASISRRRLLVEWLEDRQLLTATPDLTIDPSTPPTALIVQYRDGSTTASSLAAYTAGSNVGTGWALVPGMREVDLSAGTSLDAALTAYKADQNVLFAEPDYHVKLKMIPNDPSFADQQWDLNNTGQMGATPGADIRAPAAWDVTTGDPSTIVAVIDTGVDYTHPDLAPNMWTNPGEIPGNGIDDDGNGYVDDVHGYNFVDHNGNPMDDYFHGTHVAGTIAAVADNGIGISGVAPNVKIMALKFLDSSGGGVTSDAIAALNYAVANGATISNNSWGGDGFSQAFQTAIENATAKGHIFVAAAGNDSNNNDTNPFYPANYKVDANGQPTGVISVAATDLGDNLAWFSNYGKQTVDVAAPGVDIYSTVPTYMTPAMANEGLVTDYGTLSGTSMATPHVTGIVALVRAVHPDWTPQQVIQQVITSSDPIPALAQKTISGGRVNAAAAVGQAPADTTPPHFIKVDPTGIVSAPIGSVNVVFSEPINPASLDSSDVVSFLGPNGAVPVYGFTPTSGTNREFQLTFDPQSTPGDYTLELGPHITDLAGNEIDQNGDGIAGQDGVDDFTASFQIVNSSLYSSGNVPIAMSGFNAFGSYLTIDDDLPIADVNVKLNLSFPRVGNLAVWLVSPQGTVVNLSYRHGGNKANFLDTVFDDEADTPISQGAAPFSGSFQPDDPLSVLDNENAHGTWQLFVQNVSAVRNRGTLNSWSLDIVRKSISDNPPPPPPENDPPVPGDDFVTATQDTPLIIQQSDLLANDTDPNNDPLTIVSVGNSSGGSVALNADGSITFTPDLGGLAPGSFQYIVSDGVNTAIGNVTVMILPLYPWHNQSNPDDVNNDGVVTPIDALMVINQINAYGSTPINSVRDIGSGITYYDVVPDNYIAANDALDVINYVNGHPLQTLSINAAAKGEARILAAATAQEAPTTPAGGDDAALLTTANPPAKAASAAFTAKAMLLASGSSVDASTDANSARTDRSSLLPTDDEPLSASAVDHCLATGEMDSLVSSLLVKGKQGAVSG
jgi:subtilisin family serine protease/subtilisin-like proprotein convertase family protein